MSGPTVILPGSHREPPPGSERAGEVALTDSVAITVVLKSADPSEDTSFGFDLQSVRRDAARARARRNALGISTEQRESVVRWLSEAGLSVDRTIDVPNPRAVMAHGTIAALHRAVDVHVGRYSREAAVFRGREGALSLPAQVADLVEAVLGIDTRPQVHHGGGSYAAQVVAPPSPGNSSGTFPGAAPAAYRVGDYSSHYRFPNVGDLGSGAIGLIGLGGGFDPTDLSMFCDDAGIATPDVFQVLSSRDRGLAALLSVETSLDIQVVAALAPGCPIVVYQGDATDKGFYDALGTAVWDRRHRPRVISISWGGAECLWTEQSVHALEGLLADAAALGITVFAASGDSGQTAGVPDGERHVLYPASSPFVTACGGTQLDVRPNGDRHETPWYEAGVCRSGGGLSDLFRQPDWQAGMALTFPAEPHAPDGSTSAARAVPDICASAAVPAGYRIAIGGRWELMGGTSAVAPLYAALLLRIVESQGCRFYGLNSLLYSAAARVAIVPVQTNASEHFDVTSPLSADGWNSACGLGRLDGTKLLNLIADRTDSAARH